MFPDIRMMFCPTKSPGIMERPNQRIRNPRQLLYGKHLAANPMQMNDIGIDPFYHPDDRIGKDIQGMRRRIAGLLQIQNPRGNSLRHKGSRIIRETGCRMNRWIIRILPHDKHV